MNKKIALKIVLMLIIITSVCLINATSSYALSSWSGIWEGNASDVAKSNQIFCRDYNGPLPYKGNTYSYKSDGEAYKKDNDNKYAYIFNFLGTGGYGTISASPAQKAFWSTERGGGVGGNSNWENDYNVYTVYHNSIKQYSKNNYTPTADTSDAKYDASTRTYGPIRISYPSWKNPKTGKDYGLSFTVKANGQTIHPTINYNDNNLYIQFTQEQIASGISSAKLYIHYDCLKTCWAKITPIHATGRYNDQDTRYFCEFHQQFEIRSINNFSPSKMYLYEIKKNVDPLYIYTDQTYEDYKGDDKTICVGNVYYELGDESYICVNGVCYVRSVPTNHGFMYYILRPYHCNEQPESGMASGSCGKLVSVNKLQKLVHVNYGIEEGNGDLEPIDIQLIPTINLNLAKYNSIIETKIKNSNTMGTGLNNAQFTVQAYQRGTDGNIYNLSIVGPDSNGVRKIVSANKEYDYSEWPKYSNSADEARRIGDRVYVQITENQSPNGYKVLNQSICIIYDLIYETNGKYFTWYPTFAPGDWTTQIPRDNFNWFKWRWREDIDPTRDENFPNRYISDLGDNIMVEEINRNNEREYIIDVFDEAVIEKLELLKVDADYNNALLSGAEFKATFENVKEFKVGGNKLSGDNPYTFTVNGSIIINDVVYIDETQPIKIILEETKVPTATSEYYYKKLEGPITITIEHTPKNGLTNGTVTYVGTEIINNNNLVLNGYNATLTIPNLRLIDLGGLVWLDGNTGIKPVVGPDGKLLNDQGRVAGVVVTLDAANNEFEKQFNNNTATYIVDNNNYIVEAKTNSNGEYKFIGLRWNKNYNLVFSYDGINYENTKYNVKVNDGERNSKAQELPDDRTNFNERFTTISYKKSNDNTVQEYNYVENDKESKLITLVDANLLEYNKNGETTTNNTTYTLLNENNLELTNSEGTAFAKYIMRANTKENDPRTKTDTEINFGLVKRGTNLAFSTDVTEAKVTINNKETNYTYNKEDNTVEIGKQETSEKAQYDLVLWESDYTYRARDYVSNDSFVDTQNTGDGTFASGENLRAFVTYKVNLQNQSAKQAYINEIYYAYDSRYEFVPDLTAIYNTNNNGITDYNVASNENNVMTIAFNKLNLGSDNGTKTLYLVFEIKDVLELQGWIDDPVNKIMTLPNTFTTSGEITSYSTDEGFVDTNSQPGNYLIDAQVEDDSDKAGGITLKRNYAILRTITGTVWDDLNKDGAKNENNPINDVIVQLIELKDIGGINYEYIWQETVSGKGIIKKVSLDLPLKLTQETSADKNDGTYKFEGFIPGDYIVRFIYGDGTTRDYGVSGEIVKYNGQDYKSTIDSKYNMPLYNTAGYSKDVSVARDNEARRLETMAWSENVDAEKGLLLKLLDLQTNEQITDYVDNYLSNNNVEKSTFITVYKKLLDTDIDNVTTEYVKNLQKITLANTWMCAQTSKINISVDTTSITTEANSTTVSSSQRNDYITTISDINLGLTERPKTQIELEKHLTQMVLRASNGQTILSAYHNNNQVEGQTDGLQTVPGTSWIFSVSPTDINTIIDGASLEYSYDIIVKNTGETDTLSSTLIDEYEKVNGNYNNFLTSKASEIKWGYPENIGIGYYLGSAYYLGGTDSKVKTEVTSIYDYINNDLTVLENGTRNMENKGNMDHYLLGDTYGAVKMQINTVLGTSEASGKMVKDDIVNKYTVTLGKNPLSSTGTLDFTNYIAEVMSYTNAAGRRTFKIDAKTSVTPGNAQAVNKYVLSNDNTIPANLKLELDEAQVEEVKIQPALGEDEKTYYTWLAVIVASVAVIALGVFVTKKYIIK